MKLSNFSIIWAIFYIGFGLGLLVIPVQFMEHYGVALDNNGTLMARILGAALTDFALTFFSTATFLLQTRVGTTS